MSINGRLPSKGLVNISDTETLELVTARAWRRLLIEGRHEGIEVTLAGGGVGSAYRDLAVQRDFYDAYHGDAAAAKRCHLNPASRIPVAYPGYSTHGWGTRVDMLFNGSSLPSSVELNLCHRFGFTREFGSADPNHFMHDGHTATKALSKAEVQAAHLYPYERPTAPAPAPAQHAETFVRAAAGDNLSVIAVHHGITLSEIEHLNPHITAPRYEIQVGEEIRVR